jgi:hypothetical protein
MAHFARIDENNIVIEVLVIDQESVDTGLFGDPKSFIQTSYNTYAGEHKLGGTPLRKNFAGIGYTYNPIKDAFIPPKPYSDWLFNEQTCRWDAPLEYPNDGKDYYWNESESTWTEIKV